MSALNVLAKLRKLVFAAGVALMLSASAAASVTVEIPPAGASTRFVDHGGRVLPAAYVYPTYWGEYWAPGASPTADEITRALRAVVAGPYLSELAQYRYIGRPVIRGSRVITASDPPSRFTDKDIEAFLDDLFDADVLPGPDEQALYVVTIPPGIYSSKLELRLGEHNFYRRDGHQVHYVWTTDSATLDRATRATTHELVESLTDPEGTAILGTPGMCTEPGWCEIADICNDSHKINDVKVAPYWSDMAGRCVMPAPPALDESEHRVSGFAASSPRSALVFAAEGASARFRTADERQDRAARRRSRNRRLPGRHAAGVAWRSRPDNPASSRLAHRGLRVESGVEVVLTSPARSARAAACTRVDTPSLRKMWLT